MNGKIVTFVLLAGALLVIALPTPADSWAPAEVAQYESPNGQYALKVIPGTEKKSAKANLYKKRRFGWKKLAAVPLKNGYAPSMVVVSDHGDYFATMDNWGHAGYGPHVVVIYKSNGLVVKSLSIGDLFTPGDISTFEESTSSRWWRADGSYIDAEAGQLVLKVRAGGALHGAGRNLTHDLRIRLMDGTHVQSLRDTLPQIRPSGGLKSPVRESLKKENSTLQTIIMRDCPMGDVSAVNLEAEVAIAMVKDGALPPISSTLWAVGVEYAMGLDLSVNQEGLVCVARIMVPSIFNDQRLFPQVEETLRAWTFEPLIQGDQATPFTTTLWIEQTREVYYPCQNALPPTESFSEKPWTEKRLIEIGSIPFPAPDKGCEDEWWRLHQQD